MFLIFVINALIMMLAVLVHFEMLSQLSRFMPRLTLRYRFRIAIGILGALVAHIIEVWIFAIAYFFLIKSGQFGHLQGMEEAGLFDCAYYSFVVYTTLGFGDIVPHGELRFLTGLESLTGLVLITWTASFMFFEMQKYWSTDD
ncbi:MAG: two pore domain potassium channel family protein [Gammaproteobacteria bacterium]|nr:two pore domain potassium channel family protein [Gammaproteobacteria bacterium]